MGFVDFIDQFLRSAVVGTGHWPSEKNWYGKHPTTLLPSSHQTQTCFVGKSSIRIIFLWRPPFSEIFPI
jgi:hypothetical protein